MGDDGRSAKAGRNDLRTERTLAAIWEALLALIGERGYESVSVAEIASRAKVNRTTFYRYFEDKDDLFRKGSVELFEKILGRIEWGNFDEPFKTLEELPRYVSSIFREIDRERAALSLLAGPRSSPEFRRIIADKTEEVIANERLVRWDAALKLFDDPALVDAYSCMMSATLIRLVIWWIEQPRPMSIERIDSVYRMIVVGGMKELLASAGARGRDAREERPI